jgi:hypothetical protein
VCKKVKLIKNSWVVNRYQIFERRGLNKLEEKYFKLKKIMVRGRKNKRKKRRLRKAEINF